MKFAYVLTLARRDGDDEDSYFFSENCTVDQARANALAETRETWPDTDKDLFYVIHQFVSDSLIHTV